MTEHVKRIAALILAVVLTASLLAGCSSEMVGTENEAIMETETKTATETKAEPEEEEDPVAWLEEQMESIQKSLLAGDYEAVIALLETMQGDLTDNAQYNALLYVAYMGSGTPENVEKAKELLENENLDAEEFEEAVEKTTNSIRTNGTTEEVKAGADTIEQMFGEHKEELRRNDPEAYEEIVKLGTNMEGYKPSDPTAYAIRYAAALANENMAEAEAILAEAEANGISAQAVKDASVEYNDDGSVTTTVEEEDKGLKTKTNRVNGTVVRVEETLTEPDGSKTRVVKDENGVVYGVAYYNKYGDLLSNTIYTYEVVRDEGSDNGDGEGEVVTISLPGVEIPESSMDIGETSIKVGGVSQEATYIEQQTEKSNQELAQTDRKCVAVTEITYKNGVCSTYEEYAVQDGSREPMLKITFDKKGNAKSLSYYENGEEKAASDGEVSKTKVEVDGDGNLAYIALPDVNEAGEAYVAIEVAFTNKNACLLPERTIGYYGNGQVWYDDTWEYDMNSGNPDVQEALVNQSMMEYAYDEEGNTMWMWYFDGTHRENHYYEPADEYYEFSNLDRETAEYFMKGEEYIQDELYGRFFNYYKDAELTSELDVYYEDGRVVREEYWNRDPEEDDWNLAADVSYAYNEAGKLDSVREFQWEGYDYTQAIMTNYAYDTAGNTTSIYEYTYGTGATLTDVKMTTYLYDDAGRPWVELVQEYDGYFGIAAVTMRQDFYFADGSKQGTIIKTLDANGNFVQTGQEQYYYDEDGNVTQMAYYAVENGNGTRTQETDYTYNEDGSQKVEVKDLVAGTSTVTESTYNEYGGVTTESVYEVDAQGNRADVGTINYSYGEDGSMSGYTITIMEADGRSTTKYYTAEGYEYQVSVYESNGKLVMLMNTAIQEDSQSEAAENETAESGTPEGGVPESGIPEGGVPEDEATEGEATEDAATEGEATEGEATEDAATEGEATEGEATEDAAAEGEATEDAATEGEATEDAAAEDAATEDTATEGETDAPSEDTTDGAEAAPQSDAAAESAEAPKASEAAPQSGSSEADAE